MGMDFYAIAPIPHLELVEDCDFHMVIGPFLEDKEYLNFYRKMKERGKTILLDNGAYEFGEPISAETYLEFIEKIRPDIVVLPDVWMSNEGTRKAAKEFIEVWNREELPAKAMFVPQGKTFIDWGDSYLCGECFLEKHVDVIGLSVGTWKDKTGIIRSYFTRHLDEKSKPPLHLLGLWNVRELTFTGMRARSFDTSMPFKLAAKNHTLTKRSICADKMDFNGELKPEQVELAKINLMALKAIADNPGD